MKSENSSFENNPMYFFMHIPKTAGTSMIDSLAGAFGESFCRWEDIWWREESLDAVYRFINREEDIFYRYNIFAGHMNLECPLITRCFRERIFIAVMRDPTQRVLSLYDYIRQQPEHPLYKELRDLSLFQALRDHDEFRIACSNAQLNQLFMTSDLEQIRLRMYSQNYVIGKLSALSLVESHLSIIFDRPLAPAPNLNISDPMGYLPLAREQKCFPESAELIAFLNNEEINFFAQMPPTLETGLAARILRRKMST